MQRRAALRLTRRGRLVLTGAVALVLAAVISSVAMAAVGMSSSFQAIRRAGWRPLALGGILWLVVAVSSLLLQLATGQLATAH